MDASPSGCKHKHKGRHSEQFEAQARRLDLQLGQGWSTPRQDRFLVNGTLDGVQNE